MLDHIGEVYAEEESVDTHAQPGVPEGEHVRHGKQHHGEGKVEADALDGHGSRTGVYVVRVGHGKVLALNQGLTLASNIINAQKSAGTTYDVNGQRSCVVIVISDGAAGGDNSDFNNATNATIKVKDIVITNPHKTASVVLTDETAWAGHAAADEFTLAFGMATDDETTTATKENVEVAYAFRKVYHNRRSSCVIFCRKAFACGVNAGV